ncbi:bestrophin-like domain [Nonomuraea sp. NPDC003754]
MLALIAAVAAAVAVVALTAFLFRKLGTEDRDPGGPSTGHAGAMLSALFLLVFAIAIIVPWTTADAARQNTFAEGQAAVETYWAAGDLPEADKMWIRQSLNDYVRFVVRDEWPLMAEGRMSPEGGARLDALRNRIDAADLDANAKAQVLDKVEELSASRSRRAADAGTTPPSGLLWLTVLTGIVVIVFPFLAGARPRGLTLVPLMAMAGMLGVGIYLTWDISHAFAGALAVGPEALQAALQEFQRIAGSA